MQMQTNMCTEINMQQKTCAQISPKKNKTTEQTALVAFHQRDRHRNYHHFHKQRRLCFLDLKNSRFLSPAAVSPPGPSENLLYISHILGPFSCIYT